MIWIILIQIFCESGPSNNDRTMNTIVTLFVILNNELPVYTAYLLDQNPHLNPDCDLERNPDNFAPCKQGIILLKQ